MGASDEAEAEFTNVYRAHYPAVRAYASVCVPAREIDDVVAEAFVVCWRRFADVPTEWTRGWLLGVTRNVVRARNRAARRNDTFIDHLVRLRPVTCVEDNHMAGEEIRELRAAFATLQTTDQELLLLAGPYELSNQDIALALGIKVNAMTVRLHRARQRLRAAMQHNAAGGAVA